LMAWGGYQNVYTEKPAEAIFTRSLQFGDF